MIRRTPDHRMIESAKGTMTYFTRLLIVCTVATLMASAVAQAKPCCCEKQAGKAIMEYRAGMEQMHARMDIVYTGDSDTDFTRGMVPHHQGAVDMAEVELKYGKDPAMKKLAAFIIRMQKTEIGMMNRWLATRGYRMPLPANEWNRKAVEGQQEAMQAMHHAMMIDYTGDVDADFARGMIPHHQGAIEMAKVLLATGRDRELHALAWDIITSQQSEIGIMERWLEAHKPICPMKKKYSVNETKGDHGDHASH